MRAALTEPSSKGQTEGQITKLNSSSARCIAALALISSGHASLSRVQPEPRPAPRLNQSPFSMPNHTRVPILGWWGAAYKGGTVLPQRFAEEARCGMRVAAVLLLVCNAAYTADRLSRGAARSRR